MSNQNEHPKGGTEGNYYVRLGDTMIYTVDTYQNLKINITYRFVERLKLINYISMLIAGRSQYVNFAKVFNVLFLCVRS